MFTRLHTGGTARAYTLPRTYTKTDTQWREREREREPRERGVEGGRERAVLDLSHFM